MPTPDRPPSSEPPESPGGSQRGRPDDHSELPYDQRLRAATAAVRMVSATLSDRGR